MSNQKIIRRKQFCQIEMGSPIKGPVKRKNTSPYKKIHLFFACPLTFASAQPRFIVTFLSFSFSLSLPNGGRGSGTGVKSVLDTCLFF